MAFIQPCYIELNNKDIISYLEDLGYYNGWNQLLKCKGIITDIDVNDKGFYNGVADDTDIKSNHYYNCGTNIELFKALTAIKDNNDLNQWMICLFDHTDADNNIEYKKGQWRLSDRKKMKKYKRQDAWIKATTDDIINHFK